MRKRNFMKKFGAIVLAAALTFTAMPANVLNVDAASSDGPNMNKPAYFRYSEKLMDKDNNPYQYPSSEMKAMQIHVVNFNDLSLYLASAVERQYLEKYRIRQDGKDYVAYCLEHGVIVNETMKLSSADDGKSYIERAYNASNKYYVMENMGLCLFYGRRDNSSIYDLLNSPNSENGGLGFRNSKYYDENAHYRLTDWEAATRQLIHESQQMFRDKDFKLVGTNLKYQTEWNGSTLGTINKYHYRSALKGQPAEDIYDYMVQLIQNHREFSSNIVSKSESKPKEIKLYYNEEDKVWESKKIHVSKERAFELMAVEGKGYKNITIELKEKDGEYNYKVIYKGTPKSDVTYTVKKKLQNISEVNDRVIWECKNGSGHIQTVATGASDPVEAYFTLNPIIPIEEPEPEPDGPTEPGTPQTEEPPEPEYFPTFDFEVEKNDANPGFDGDVSTPMGDATLAATYTLERSFDGGSTWETIDSVTLNEYGESATLSDQPWTSMDQFDESFTGETEEHILEPENPDDAEAEGEPCGCGTVEPTKAEWSGKVQWRITETRPDGRYLEPDPYDNVREYSASYYAKTEDERQYACEDPAWTDISYDVDFSVTTGDSSAPNSGNGSGTIADVDDILSFGTQTFINDNFRGKVTISKSLENEDVFNENEGGLGSGQKDSTKSYWRFKLASGGYENHPYVRFVRNDDLSDGTASYTVVRDNSGSSCETTYMKIGSNGDMVVEDLPYGTYTVEEVSADDNSYVLEQFTVTIDEYDKYIENGGVYTATSKNDNRYDYNLRDIKKSNKIKIVKTDAETGKQVNLKGTKFYIVYKGNPELTDEQNKAKYPDTYNRFLPNANSITADGPYTFECDENGEVTIPYALEYGRYEIREWLLPDGYFVGEYDATGKGTSHNYGKVEEGQIKALTGSTYSDLVTILDSDGNKVKYKDKSEYALNEVFNYYTFEVTKQDTHVDGNFGQKVDSDGNISAADPNYNAKDYPYVVYYKAVAMANNSVKGQIEIEKSGEILTGFKEEKVNGISVRLKHIEN